MPPTSSGPTSGPPLKPCSACALRYASGTRPADRPTPCCHKRVCGGCVKHFFLRPWDGSDSPLVVGGVCPLCGATVVKDPSTGKWRAS